MKIYYKIDDPHPPHSLDSPIGLSIGTFDGVHKGHQYLLNTLRQIIGKSGQIFLLTYTNHPSQVLKHQTTPLLCTIPHKIKLLEEYGVNDLVIIPFTKDLSHLKAEQFLEEVRSAISFTHLVVGYDTKLGKDRHGDKSHLELLGKILGFELHYLDVFKEGDKVVSSTAIRSAIQKGDFREAQNLLGRPYSIYSLVSAGHGKGKHIGFPTANMEVAELCLPPFGVYAVSAIYHGQRFNGIANLGVAPTIKMNAFPTLEVHLFNHLAEDLYGKYIEVFFHEYIRPEIKFDSVDSLRSQISRDIEKAKQLEIHFAVAQTGTEVLP